MTRIKRDLADDAREGRMCPAPKAVSSTLAETT
jgi:hypothetical protein